jgi:hypothetical protein
LSLDNHTVLGALSPGWCALQALNFLSFDLYRNMFTHFVGRDVNAVRFAAGAAAGEQQQQQQLASAAHSCWS